MQSPGREPSMEDILASIKKVIAEEKGQRAAAPTEAAVEAPASEPEDEQEEVLALDEPLAPPVDLGPPLLDEQVAGQSRNALEQLSTIASSVPPQSQVNRASRVHRSTRTAMMARPPKSRELRP